MRTEVEMGMKWENFIHYYPNVEIFTHRVQTNIECPECGKFLFERKDIVLTGYPLPQYQYECACGFVGYSHRDWETKFD